MELVKGSIELGLGAKCITKKEEMKENLYPDNPPDPDPPPKALVDAYLLSIGKRHLIW